MADRGAVVFQIPEVLQERYGYPALTERAKRKILGLNNARLYVLSKLRERYLAAGPAPSNTRHRWVRKT